MLSAIIVAAGSSRRMGFDKLAALLDGRSVLRRSIDAFLESPDVAEIIVVCPPDRWADLKLPPDLPKPVRRADGGTERQHSVANGLAVLSPDATHVAVHDGARPLVSPADISRCHAAALDHGAAALARRVSETLKRSSPDDFSAAPVSREHLWFMETPQIFETSLLFEATAAVRDQSLIATDEVSALEAIGHPVKLIESSKPNPKITTPADLPLAEAILRQNP
jgi:2-C-methyl-D-erythritol 4-phosphate cytidylyltransferase